MSVYLLCDVGLSTAIASRLYKSNINLEEIKNNNDIVNKIFGENSLKAREIIRAIKRLDSIKYSESIFILLEFDLSLTILKKMNHDGIKMEHFEDPLFSIKLKDFYQYTESTIIKILESYKKFKNEPTMGEKNIDYSKALLNKLKGYRQEYISIEAIKNNSELDFYTKNNDDFIYNLKILEDSGKIRIKDGIVQVYYIPLKEAIEHLKKDEWKDIYWKVLQGKTYAEIGEEKNLTRERIRQLANTCQKNMPQYTKEDLLSPIFKKYNWQEKIFCDIWGVEKYVYNYLKNKYNIGEEELEELLDDETLNIKQRQTLEKYLGVIIYKNNVIPENRTKLLETIIMTENRSIDIEEIIKLYNESVINLYSNTCLTTVGEDEYRNIQGLLDRSKMVIASYNRTYRYYNFNLLKKSDIDQLTSILHTVIHGIYSAEYFFINNKQLMNDIDIKNKYELHNLLRRIIKEDDIISFGRMPNILIGETDQKKFLLKQIRLLSPVSTGDFEDIIYEQFGYDKNTLHSYLYNYLNSYITNDIIDSEGNKFTNEQIERLKNIFTDNIYAINDVGNVIEQEFGKEYIEYISNYNFNKIEYIVREQYIFNKNIGAINNYIRNEIISQDIYEESTKLSSAGSSYVWVLTDLLIQNEIYKIAENKYITKKGFIKFGINIDSLKNFCNKILNYFKYEDVFNLFFLKNNNLINSDDYCGFGDTFIESSLQYTKGIKMIRFEGSYFFVKSEKEYNKSDLITLIIEEYKCKTSKEIYDILEKIYGIKVDIYEIRYLINKKIFYRVPDTDEIKKY